MSLQDQFKNKLLWRVYLIWFMRRIVPLILLQVAILVLVVNLFAESVFLSKVLQNMGVTADGGYWALMKYLFATFFNTRPLVQIVILVGLGFVALLLRDLGRSLRTYKGMWKK